MLRLSLCTLVLLSACDTAVAPDDPVDPDARTGRDAFKPNLDMGADVPERRDDTGDSCEANEECQSGFCVLVRGQERVCTRRCANDQECPEDWICRQVTNAGADVTFICVPRDADCAGADLTSDPAHCGACEAACEFANATPLCVDSTCAMGDCFEGFHDLDDEPGDQAPDNGCEYACTETLGGGEACDAIDNDCDGQVDEGIDTNTDLQNCGGCGERCQPPNATGDCAEGVCSIDECLQDFQDADGEVANGCEAGCSPSNGGVEACDNIDNDCDGSADEGFDFANDEAHCGACNQNCTRANAQTRCAESICVFEGCLEGFFDENGNPDDGCEVGCRRSNGGVERCDLIDNDCDGAIDEGVDTTMDVLHCGECGNSCERANAINTCEDSMCRNRGCVDGFQDIDGEFDNGCEYACRRSNGGIERCDGLDNDCDRGIDEGIDLSSDPGNCGACNNACDRPNALTACVESECVSQGCVDGFFDVNGELEDGCEVGCQRSNGGVEACDNVDNDCDGDTDEGYDLQTDAVHCGRCNNACDIVGAITDCDNGVCVAIDCREGFHDLDDEPGCEYACVLRGDEACNGQDDDCDGETDEGFDLRAPENCGRCGNRCQYINAEPLCVGGNCLQGRCLEGFHDVDGRAITGCEYDCDITLDGVEICDEQDNDCDGEEDEGINLLVDPNNCGGCNNRCDLPNARESCLAARCRVDGCDEGFADADGEPESGCECEIRGAEQCNEADDDCDGRVDEAFNFQNDPLHCGGCDNVCGGDNVTRAVCDAAECVVVECANGFIDLNEDPDDGCEHDCGVDPAPPECGGVPPDFDYDGVYELVPKQRYNCGIPGFGNILEIDVERATFLEVGEDLRVTLVTGRRDISILTGPGPWGPIVLEERRVANDGTFDASTVIAADCAELFSLDGEFDAGDPNKWTGTLSISFQGPTCGLTDCAAQNLAVSGCRQGEVCN